ncbi:xenobiotic compound monooxygenase, DszA family [Sporothrix schenckii 1099-18]|uniref:Xenobiotic compound monooxygenase, DszA family n=1 Tax=Sporothrix schenckii 1099-18 TaxID=1397361 RepID=A0A0F2MJH7_SPOSC|nr:xenobiotic compound monooxygenase, DszA family [Sporothrix schenckii 1099-18]KJR89777.1 xenobiotic compound monooxygenase, DszA family [Sporothrix schenckii 1099-18]
MADATTTPAASAGPGAKKQMILNAFVMNTPGHQAAGLWHHPTNRTDEYNTLGFWTDLAKLLDDAGFHAIFIADTLGAYDVYRGPGNFVPALASGAQFPVSDPLYLVPALAAATKHLIIGVTASVTYEQPYALARRLSTVDHYANGRFAWNIVTSYLDSAAKNHGLDEQIPHDERYARAHEYLEVLYKLWEGSFRADAVLADRTTGVYIADDAVQNIAHEGKYFRVPGPHFVAPSPQRTPFLFQAGTSSAGNGFGGKHGEAIFVSAQTPQLLRQTSDNIRAVAAKEGRHPDHIKVIAGVHLIVGKDDADAAAKEKEFRAYSNTEGALALFGGWTGVDLSKYDDDQDFRLAGDNPRIQSLIARWSATVPGTDNQPWTKRAIVEFLTVGGLGIKFVGGPQTVADALEHWLDDGGIDGFNLAHVTNPGSFEDIIAYLLPELRKRGRFRGVDEPVPGTSAREVFLGNTEHTSPVSPAHLPPDHPGSKYTWHKGQPAPKLNEIKP